MNGVAQYKSRLVPCFKNIVPNAPSSRESTLIICKHFRLCPLTVK